MFICVSPGSAAAGDAVNAIPATTSAHTAASLRKVLVKSTTVLLSLMWTSGQLASQGRPWCLPNSYQTKPLVDHGFGTGDRQSAAGRGCGPAGSAISGLEPALGAGGGDGFHAVAGAGLADRGGQVVAHS